MAWYAFITQDLKARIRAGDGLPDSITLHGLSSFYNVSTSPVRMAVEQLLDEKFLVKSPGGRLAANPQKLGRGGKTHSVPTPPANHHERISLDLIQWSLAGEPIFLREEEMADRYGVSRTVIRQVFNRLAGSAVLEHLPRRGWRLRPYRPKDLDDFTRVRVKLELEALELAWPRLEEERLREILEGNTGARPEDDEPRFDNSLHAYFIERADNFYIRDFFERHGRYFNVIFDWEALDRDAAIETARQHRQILQAVLDDNPKIAAEAMEYHIRYNHPLLRKIASCGPDSRLTNPPQGGLP